MNNKTMDMLFILYRLFFMFFAVYVISRFTVLGDYERYVSSVFGESLNNFMSSPNDTYLTDLIISGLKKLFLGRMLFVNIVLNVASSICLIRLTRKMKYSFIFIILFMSPSFNIWSSFASKELIVVCAGALLLAELISFLRDEKFSYVIIGITSVVLMFYKLQLVLPVIQLVLSIFLIKKTTKGTSVIIIPAILCVNILGIFIMRDTVDELVRGIIVHFSTSSRSTRDASFLMETYGFFAALPHGMFITFFGPTVEELSTSPLHLFTAIESALILASLLYLLIFKDRKVIRPDYVNLMVVINFLLVLMFFQTPWGILNPGSAIRYRADYYLFILVIVFLYRHDFYTIENGDSNE